MTERSDAADTPLSRWLARVRLKPIRPKPRMQARSQQQEVPKTPLERSQAAGVVNESGPLPAVEIASAGSTRPASQPLDDVTADPIHSRYNEAVADPTVVFVDEDDTDIDLGLFGRYRRWSRSRGIRDDSFHAAARSQLSFLCTSVLSGIAVSAAGEAFSEPTGHDLILLGGGTALLANLVGLGLNVWRLVAPRRR
ncbi:hypothetical protein [Virgisporangium aurantiacum]|uniref:Uncharacterized protein n=1 Tax=Virgisporangium aurantiacum TaxID=175570 RepID=A0A8J3Z176_9ACTN|nr:hypothetical protein [Virgisporangium aurantiacum]GIJ53213.1 hypothetical protein Vau01_007290 [Virgisporangium aurantiacum]